MKKRFLTVAMVALIAASASAQHSKNVPPPPPPPTVSEAPLPPPPPPPPPKEPTISADFDAFMKRNPTIQSVRWRNESIIFQLKDGKEESYQLNDDKSVKEAESKYGKLPTPPPPPPPPPAPPKHPTLS